MKTLKKRILNTLQTQTVAIYLDSNEDRLDRYAQYECIAAWEALEVCEIYSDWTPAFEFVNKHKGKWIFAWFSFESYAQPLQVSVSTLAQPVAVLWIPRYWITLDKQGNTKGNAPLLEEPLPKTTFTPIELQPIWSKVEYLERYHKVIHHIKEGNVYELNLCQRFEAQNVEINPVDVFSLLNEHTKMPYSAYIRYKNEVMLSASPERFLAKRGQKLIAQPMKGTQRKQHALDIESKHQLRQSLKNQAENIMIVDLMRNDLAKSCVTGSITVTELFEVLDYGNIYQMISTVEGQLKAELSFLEAFYHAFPMGSMTGAPKQRSVQLIQELEGMSRGWFSGSVGYINPEQEADFNVLIRSLSYHIQEKTLCLQTGGALVYHSDSEQEYEESLLKAERIRSILRKVW